MNKDKFIDLQVEKFEKEVFGYSMNEYRMEGDTIRPIMCQKGDAKDFLQNSLQQQKEMILSELESMKEVAVNENHYHYIYTKAISGRIIADKWLEEMEVRNQIIEEVKSLI